MSSENVKTILYVDDEEVNLFLFEKIFEHDFKVVTAPSGQEGLEKLEKYSGQIDVVISDMRMPLMNGLEFISEAKGLFPDTSYFILTGYEFNTELEDALEMNLIDKVYKKPFDYDLIKAAVNESVSVGID